jgi:hypothetical protein
MDETSIPLIFCAVVFMTVFVLAAAMDSDPISAGATDQDIRAGLFPKARWRSMKPLAGNTFANAILETNLIRDENFLFAVRLLRFADLL